MREKKAYAFIKPCGHAALLVADKPQVLKDEAKNIARALKKGFEMRLVDVAEIHDGTISFCGKTCRPRPIRHGPPVE